MDNQIVEDPIVQEDSAEVHNRETKAGKSHRRLHQIARTGALLLFIAVFASACAPTDGTAFVPDTNICNIYNLIVDWIRIIAGIATVVAFGFIGAQRLLSSFLPDINVRMGTVILTIIVGLAFVGFGENLANTTLVAFGLPYIACPAGGPIAGLFTGLVG